MMRYDSNWLRKKSETRIIEGWPGWPANEPWRSRGQLSNSLYDANLMTVSMRSGANLI